MKTSINKSKVMKLAWTIYKGNNPYNYSFSASLRRAWWVEKESIAYIEKQAKKVIAVPTAHATPVSESYMAGCADYYRNAPRGTYHGD